VFAVVGNVEFGVLVVWVLFQDLLGPKLLQLVLAKAMRRALDGGRPGFAQWWLESSDESLG
jgi:hypothetical protein